MNALDEKHLYEKNSRAKAQRRKGAKKDLRNAVALCAFAPLREKSLCSPQNPI